MTEYKPHERTKMNNTELLDWAIERWYSEVRNMPYNNIYRPVLDQTWRQVIRYAGGDPEEILGCPVQRLYC